MRLNPPTVFIFFISLLLAVLAVVSKLGYVAVPGFIPHQSFGVVQIKYPRFQPSPQTWMQSRILSR